MFALLITGMVVGVFLYLLGKSGEERSLRDQKWEEARRRREQERRER